MSKLIEWVKYDEPKPYLERIGGKEHRGFHEGQWVCHDKRVKQFWVWAVNEQSAYASFVFYKNKRHDLKLNMDKGLEDLDVQAEEFLKSIPTPTTPKEILEKHIVNTALNIGSGVYDSKGYPAWKDVYEAMEEYAKQEAVAFALWNSRIVFNVEEEQKKYSPAWIDEFESATMEGRYELYLKSKEK